MTTMARFLESLATIFQCHHVVPTSHHLGFKLHLYHPTKKKTNHAWITLKSIKRITWKHWFGKTFYGCGATLGELKGRKEVAWEIDENIFFYFFSVMCFVIGLPVAQIILFCLAIGHDPTGLPIAVSNHELPAGLLAQQECPIAEGCNYTLLSCRYLEFLKNRSVTVVS